jgi:hypothetical protein
MTTDLLRDPLRGQLAEAANQIREGMPISAAMEAHGLTTSTMASCWWPGMVR